MQVENVVKQAANALRTLTLWNLSIDDISQNDYHSLDPKFIQWSNRFQQWLDSYG